MAQYKPRDLSDFFDITKDIKKIELQVRQSVNLLSDLCCFKSAELNTM